MYPLQHEQMLVVRKEGKAHDRYNSFRSAFELLESVGRQPDDCFEEDETDLLPVEKLELRVNRQMDDIKADMQQRIEQLMQKDITQQQQIENQQQQIEKLKQQVDMLVHQNQIDMFEKDRVITI